MLIGMLIGCIHRINMTLLSDQHDTPYINICIYIYLDRMYGDRYVDRIHASCIHYTCILSTYQCKYIYVYIYILTGCQRTRAICVLQSVAVCCSVCLCKYIYMLIGCYVGIPGAMEHHGIHVVAMCCSVCLCTYIHILI